MKSRISSFRIGKELWFRQIWLFVITGLMYFVLCTITGLVSMNMMAENSRISPAEMRENFLGFFTPLTGGDLAVVLSMFVFVTVFVGTAAGINAFAYLHSKNKVDFYHGLPLSRSRYFLIQAVICLVDYLVPSIFFINLLLVIGAVRGLAGAAAFAAAWKMILAGLAPLLVTYCVGSLAMLLTGRLIVGGLGVWTFMVLGPIFAALIEGWKSTFFMSYYSPFVYADNPMWKYSPYVYPWNAVLKMNWRAVGLSLLAGLILLGINLLIYRRRPSEAAGKSMAFSLPAAVIQVVITVIASLMIGFFFGTIFETFSNGWFVFGLIFGGLLTYLIIQMIYTPSFRQLFSGKWRLLASAVIVFIIAVFSLFDPMGLDRKLPAQGAIEKVAVVCSAQGFDSDVEMDSRFDMALPCDDTVYAFLKKLSTDHVESRDSDEDWDLISFQIRMTGQSGKNHYRQYTMRIDEIREEVASLYNYETFKKNLYPSLNEDPKMVQSLELKMGDRSLEMYSGKEKEKEKHFFQALREDVLDMRPENVKTEIPVGVVECTVTRSVNASEDALNAPEEYYNDILIYPSFERTLALLDEEQKAMLAYPEEIREVDIYDMRKQDNRGNYKKIATYRDQARISETVERIIPLERVTIWTDFDHDRSVEVYGADESLIESRFLKK